MYDQKQIEEKWLQFWEDTQLFQDTVGTANSANSSTTFSLSHREKIYLLIAFAYPSGAGLHVGHVESKTAMDILARYYRMKGTDVFFPVGWDAFGLPAENFAIKTGTPPAQTTKAAIDTFRRQLKRVGISYDWKSELATSHPGYYRWTQWLFLQMYDKGLAYHGKGMVNWCPSCQTVLANEQVVNGECERCGTQVIQKDMTQWFFKITQYRDELISGLDQVDWPHATKQQQLNWIGKREGAVVTFAFAGEAGSEGSQTIDCFTTRLDTIFGVTFVVISPEKAVELDLVSMVTESTQRSEVQQYLDTAFTKTEEARQVGEKDKSGVFTGLHVINPVSKESIPVYVADYVLGGYGTGAVMGVPAHDERDLGFAKKHKLPVKFVVAKTGSPEDTSPHSDRGVLVNSGSFSGQTSDAAAVEITAQFSHAVRSATTYKLRDWLISRQRYWGAPIPIVYDPEGQPHPVKEEHLPWLLPTDVDFKPTGESPLRSSKEFVERTERLYGTGWRPEYDTMDTFVDSSWYFLRYVSARNEEVFSDPEQLAKWLPVDFYMIGPEHIVLHLLYSRFFTKFLRDQGYLKFDEPFLKMRHQGMILGPDGKKMSKSKGNVINPDEVIEKFGADSLRMYEMFMGPIETDKPWNVTAVMGIYRFLQRMQGAFESELSAVETANASAGETRAAIRQKLHSTIEKVGSDIPALKFNTAIAAMMEFINEWEVGRRQLSDQKILDTDEVSAVVRMIAPFAPFLAEELWSRLDSEGRTESVHLSSWPVFDRELAKPAQVVIPIQINGKVRARLTVNQDLLTEHSLVLEQALSHPDIQKHLEGKKISKQLYIAGKIVSIALEK